MKLNADNWEVIGASEAELEARRDEAVKLTAALYAALALINRINPGPGDADVRGPAQSVSP